MEFLSSFIGTLLTLVLLLVLITAVFSPFESLGWWAGWSGPNDDPELILKKKRKKQKDAHPDEYFVYYLSGIGVASEELLAPYELELLKNFKKLVPKAKVITDVFPYSVTNNPLTGERLLKPLWSWVKNMQLKNPDNLLPLAFVTLRNVAQVFVSSDPRYGPIYNLGVAKEIGRSLERHHYPFSSGKPIYIIGYSGGGQIAVGCAPYLRAIAGAPIFVITIGGFLSDDIGIESVAHLYHNYGSDDWMQAMGALFWVGRWPMVLKSGWNRMFAQNKMTFRDIGPMTHVGPRSYFDEKALESNTKSNSQLTAIALRTALLDSKQLRL